MEKNKVIDKKEGFIITDYHREPRKGTSETKAWEIRMKVFAKLKLDPGYKVKSGLLGLDIVNFYRSAKKYCELQKEIDRLLILQNKEKEKIIETAKKSDEIGFRLRGIISEKHNFDLTVFPSVHNVFDQKKLLKQTDVLSSAGLINYISLNFLAPSASTKSLSKKIKVLEKNTRSCLKIIGLYNSIASVETNLVVDEKKLSEKIKKKEIKLLPKTKKTQVAWKIKTKK